MIFLNNNHYNNDIINFILKYKSEYIKNILVNIDFDNLIYNKNKTDKYFDIINSLALRIYKIKYIKRNSIYIREVLSKYDKNVLKKFLNSDDNNKNTFVMNMQNTILKIFNVSSEKINYCKTIIKYCEKGNILELLKSVEVFFDKVDVDINSFFSI